MDTTEQPDPSDPNLNETGRINMGDAEALKENHPELLGADGAPVVATPGEKTLNEVLAETNRPPVQWHHDEEATDAAEKDMWFPEFFIPHVGQKFGMSRPHKNFFPEERSMILHAFLNECSKYLFGTPAFDEVNTSDGVSFRPNKDFIGLPVYNPQYKKGRQ